MHENNYQFTQFFITVDYIFVVNQEGASVKMSHNELGFVSFLRHKCECMGKFGVQPNYHEQKKLIQEGTLNGRSKKMGGENYTY